jgi:hypothetical protein
MTRLVQIRGLGMGVDSLSLRVMQWTPFRPEVQALIREIDYASGLSRIKRSAHYQGVADLRSLGIDAILHAYCKHTKPHNHKLEILDTGQKTYSELEEVIQAVFEVNSEHLGVMRLDLCADIRDIPVLWFQPRVRFKHKRFAGEVGKLQYEKLGSGKIETLIAGKRPNVFRIYDKVAESKMQFQKILRKTSADSELPEFEKVFGFPQTATLTRIERQYGGNRIPPNLDTFGKLANAPSHNPFEPLEIVRGEGGGIPTVEDCSGPTEWMTGMQMRQMIHEMGMQQYRAWLNKHSNGNAARIIERYRKFLPNDEADVVSTELIYELFRESVIRQLAA